MENTRSGDNDEGPSSSTNGHGSSNSATPTPTATSTEKRKSTEVLLGLERARKKFLSTFDTPLPRMNTLEEGAQGPIHNLQDDSFILNSENAGDFWEGNSNPNGIVPVIVHPGLVNGLDATDPKPLNKKQREGLQYLWNCFEEKQGGIVAHDMGLGKTRTGVTLLATLLQQSGKSRGKSVPALRKSIILAPKNGVSVWKEEFEKWCPPEIQYNIEVIRPNQKDGWDIVNEFKSPDSRTQFLVLSYETFLKYNSKYDEGFVTYPPGSIDVVICDEAHVLKNDQTQRVKNLKKFQPKGKVWFGFTGTPYQNNVGEFCNLVHFFRKNIFGPTDFKKVYCNPIMRVLNDHGRLHTPEMKKLIQDLRALVRPAIHSRTNFLNIEKHEITLCVPLDGYFGGSEEQDPVQHEMYKRISEICIDSEEMSFYEKLSYLYKACIHPQDCYDAISSKRANVFKDVISFYDQTLPPALRSNVEFKRCLYANYSGKIAALGAMALYLRRNKPDEKMVIVSASTVLLKLIKTVFLNSFNFRVAEYDGEKSDSERVRNLKSFDEDKQVHFLLLSLKAGGTALTLVRANHLVLMDPDYNPATDRQALGRIYRPGQTRPVYLYRMLATGTIEEVKYLNQLGKEEFEKFMKGDGQVDIQVPYNEIDLLKYDCDGPSSLLKVLDKLGIESFNDLSYETMDRAFAEELKRSNQYKNVYEVPEDVLPVLHHIFSNHVSYAFHISTVPDLVAKAILSEQEGPAGSEDFWDRWDKESEHSFSQ